MKKLTKNILISERSRILKLLLFYKNDAEDINFYIKNLILINKELENFKFKRNEPFEFILERTLKEPENDNIIRLKEKFILFLRK